MYVWGYVCGVGMYGGTTVKKFGLNSYFFCRGLLLQTKSVEGRREHLKNHNPSLKKKQCILKTPPHFFFFH